MTFDHRDLTIDDVLRDPLIGAVMRADRVEPRDLERLLRGKARCRGVPTRMPLPSSALMAARGAARACCFPR